jgi:hypothetical protein
MTRGQTVILIISAYLAAGLLLVFVGPAARVLRDQLAELAVSNPDKPVKRAAFAIAVALAIILLWPVFVYEAWRHYRCPTAYDAAVRIVEMALDEAEKNKR